MTERHNPSDTLIILLILIITLPGLACQVSGAVPAGTPPVPSPTAVGEPTTDWITLYFTQPEAPSSETLRGGPDRELADAIRSARASVEVAAQQLDLWSIRDALIDAHHRGVSVRVVVESDYMDEREIQDLVAAGIPLLGDRREGLMHNKFAVIDRQEVWTGSANFTINGIYRNNNNLVRVRSPELAGNYLAEFEEMFVDDRFGPGSPANTPNPRIEHDGVRIETLYSPDDGVAGRLLELVSEAQESVHFMAYSFTSDDLREVLIERHQAGVDVAGVFEEYQYQTNTGTEFDHLKGAGIDVRLDGNPRNMHHKVIIIDGSIVVTGSYNFSRSAEERNDENVLVIHSPEVAEAFLEEFERVFSDSKP